MQASALLLCWGSYPWAHNLLVLIIYLFFFRIMLPSVVSRLATDLAVRMFPGVWKLLSFLRLPSQDGTPFLERSSLPTFFVSFSSFIYFLPVFEDNDLLFWMPGVLCQHSEVVLWNLLSFEMFF